MKSSLAKQEVPKLQREKVFCKICGFEGYVSTEQTECPYCGHPLLWVEEESPEFLQQYFKRFAW